MYARQEILSIARHLWMDEYLAQYPRCCNLGSLSWITIAFESQSGLSLLRKKYVQSHPHRGPLTFPVASSPLTKSLILKGKAAAAVSYLLTTTDSTPPPPSYMLICNPILHIRMLSPLCSLSTQQLLKSCLRCGGFERPEITGVFQV